MNNCVSRTRDLLVAKVLIIVATNKVIRWSSSRQSPSLLINLNHIITKKFAVGRRNTTRCPVRAGTSVSRQLVSIMNERQLGWWECGSENHQVGGSIPGSHRKKTPSLVPCPKHCGARPNSQGDGPPCTGGAGVRGFSQPVVRRSFYLSNNAVGAVSPPAGQVFYLFIYLVLLIYQLLIGYNQQPNRSNPNMA